jgi:hypothetical protein
MVAFEDGSTASISYGSAGHPSAGKERLEVMGRGHSIVVDDFRELTIDGHRSQHGQDKGHAAQFVSLAQSLRSTDSTSSLAAIESMRVTLDAAASLAAFRDRG